MQKLIQRLMLFFIGLPVILGSVYFFPYYHFLLLHFIVFISLFIAITEVHLLFKKKLSVYPLSIHFIAGVIIPFSSYSNVLGVFSHVRMLFAVGIALYFVFFVEVVYSFSKTFSKSLQRLASAVFIVFYPGFFISFLSAMTLWRGAVSYITVFFLMVCSCDSFAWLFGMLFGKNNRGYVPASPNKSLAGFGGGIIGSVGAGVAAYYMFANQFGSNFSGVIILGCTIAVAAIIGDIIESILKRSAHVKDAGAVIPGRGGIMDSVDSILISCPVFYFCVKLLFDV